MPVVTIRMAKGRTIDQKRVIVKEITETIVSTLNVDPSWVTVLIEEFDKDCIGKSGKLLCES
ncbi:MAG: 4-oxalocrotonate tautomerase family protein [Methanomicrobiales archaeon]|nr:4-oxalocrotonate tautomerase family protein [Methanomicrobiales archaeon]